MKILVLLSAFITLFTGIFFRQPMGFVISVLCLLVFMFLLFENKGEDKRDE